MRAKFVKGDKITLNQDTINFHAVETLLILRLTPGKTYEVISYDGMSDTVEFIRDNGKSAGANGRCFELVSSPELTKEEKLALVREAFGFESATDLLEFLK